MPALAITLGVDIVSLSHKNHVSYFCSSGVNLYFPPPIHADEVIRRKDIVVISHNSVDHFDALLPLRKDLKLPIYPMGMAADHLILLRPHLGGSQRQKSISS